MDIIADVVNIAAIIIIIIIVITALVKVTNNFLRTSDNGLV